MATERWPSKDPYNVERFAYDWSGTIAAGDTIAEDGASALVLSGGVVIEEHAVGEAENVAAGLATVTKVSGGTPEADALIQLRVVTEQGDRFEKTVILPIRED